MARAAGRETERAQAFAVERTLPTVTGPGWEVEVSCWRYGIDGAQRDARALWRGDLCSRTRGLRYALRLQRGVAVYGVLHWFLSFQRTPKLSCIVLD